MKRKPSFGSLRFIFCCFQFDHLHNKNQSPSSFSWCYSPIFSLSYPGPLEPSLKLDKFLSQTLQIAYQIPRYFPRRLVVATSSTPSTHGLTERFGSSLQLIYQYLLPPYCAGEKRKTKVLPGTEQSSVVLE